MFAALPDKPDADSPELAILDFWDREGIFAQLRAKNSGGPRFSFIDGPVTANKTLGVHTAWGRTLKDVFQRYKAMRGFEQRYQNGFDCQGLWIEVGVERELGLNLKPEIEEYGLAAFAEKCREVVEKSSADLMRQGRVYEIVHLVNTMRKEAGLELTDRIRLSLPAADQDLLDYRDWIAAETLAISVDTAPVEQAVFEPA